jgi:hypothetical protein
MKYFLILSVALIQLFYTPEEKRKSRFIGEWKAEHENKKIRLSFNSDGYAYLTINNEIKGGKEFLINKKKASLTYKINSKTTPMQVDLIITLKDDGSKKTLPCIAEFIDKNNMKFVFGDSGTRPKNFNSNEALIFKRVK